MTGNFVISLDFELLWGMRDVATRASYGANVLGARKAIPAMLDLFHRRSMRATWAIVGLLLCESKDELMASLPPTRPTYTNPALSSYAYLGEVGANERADPYYFGASLARLIAACPGQEIGTHTFSHYYCLEKGQTIDQFKADLRCAIDQLGKWGVICRSIVFPRNQYAEPYLVACREAGITHFRGKERIFVFGPEAGETRLLRICRLADAYIDLSGPNAPPPARASGALVNAASSRFLRPYRSNLAVLDGLRLRRIVRAMQAAAETGGTFHIWWHPHNFGVELEANMVFLTRIIDCYQRLAGELGMQSKTMSEL
jgi:Polysaccharide deacetylase